MSVPACSTGLDWLEPSHQGQRQSTWTFLSACLAVGQKRKGHQWDLKCVCRQTSKMESDYYNFITFKWPPIQLVLTITNMTSKMQRTYGEIHSLPILSNCIRGTKIYSRFFFTRLWGAILRHGQAGPCPRPQGPLCFELPFFLWVPPDTWTSLNQQCCLCRGSQLSSGPMC